jgi:hypothetical protein
VIGEYLRELGSLLPWTMRRRVLAEVEDHLRSSAVQHGEEEAVRRFGPPRDLAADLAAAHVAPALRVAVAFAAALVCVPLAVYVVTENSLPPAPWPEGAMPETLAWKIRVGAVLYVVAVAAFATAGALAFLRRASGTALLALAATAVSVAAMGVVGCALSLEWANAVPGAPGSLAALGAAQTLVALVGGVVFAEAGRLVRIARARAPE